MDTLLSLKIFRQVVDSGGFTAAAAVLDLSVAMVSKHVQHLETYLGTRLLTRTSRRVALNQPGQQFYERCCEILDQLDEAESSLGKSETPRGTLRLTAPTWFSNQYFARQLCEYRSLYPEVSLDISLSDGFVDLAEEGLDLALRVLQKPPALSPSVRRVATLEFALVASPQYLSRRGRPRVLDDLRHHDTLVYSYMPSPNEDFSFWEKTGWRLNNTTLIAQLAAQGAGLAILPRLLFEEEALAGQLEILETDFELPHPSLYLVTHGRRHHSARVRSFMDFWSAGPCPG